MDYPWLSQDPFVYYAMHKSTVLQEWEERSDNEEGESLFGPLLNLSLIGDIVDAVDLISALAYFIGVVLKTVFNALLEIVQIIGGALAALDL